MNSTFRFASLGVSLAALTVPAWAQAVDTPHFYGGIAYERVEVDVGVDFKFDSAIVKAGWRFNPYFGIEADLGRTLNDDKVRINNVEVKSKMDWMVGVYGVGFVPLSDRVDLIGRIGYREESISFSPGNIKSTGGGTTWSLGGQFFLNENHGLRLDYSQESDVKTVALGYAVKF